MSERKKELIDYITLLQKLNHGGFSCNNELNKALKELDKLMYENDSEKHAKNRVKIIIFEETYENFKSKFRLFDTILGDSKSKTVNKINSKNEIYMYNDTTDVRIYWITKDYDTSKLRGLSGNLVINNTTNQTCKDIQKMVIQIK